VRVVGTSGLAIVLGASGFIGTRLVRRLWDAGAEVRAIDIAPPRERLNGVTYERFDVRQPLPVDVGTGAEVVYNLAAVHRTPGHKSHEYYSTNVLGALNATMLARACDIPTIVFTSSIAVYGPCEERITEASPTVPVSDYGVSKQIAEVIHRDWLQQRAERRLVIVRPGAVFGPGERGNFTRIAGALRRGLFAYPGRKTTVKSGGHVDELLHAMEFALAWPEREITFNFAYPEEATTEDIVRTFSHVAGFAERHPVVPTLVVLAAARVCEAATLLGFHNSLHPDRVMKLVKSTRIAPVWLEQHGFKFGTDLRSGLELWHTESGGSFQ
jgi:nucleoside-diphosphate-sugar epimerase